MNIKPRQGPTPVGQRNRAQTIPSKRFDGPQADEWGEDDYREIDGHACRNCDKPIDHEGYCSRYCEDMDRHPLPLDDYERFVK